MDRENFWEGPERRRFRRYSVADLFGVLDGKHSFELLILSEGGMLLRMSGDVQLGRTVLFDLNLPEARVRGQARVVFSTGEPGSSGRPSRRVGLEFTELEDRSRDLLKSHVAGELP